MLFSQIVGQNHIKQKLIQTVKDNRISHTQLFAGKEGYGNLPLALAYGQYINCENPHPNDSCGVCQSCVKYLKLEHQDLHLTVPTISKIEFTKEIIADFRKAFIQNPYLTSPEWIMQLAKENNKQGNITAKEARDIITRLSYTVYNAKYKVQIIWMPEYLGKEGNILLKMLEEPPAKTVIILVSNGTEDILPTILSRAQLIKIPRIDDDSVVKELVLKYACEEEKAHDIVRISEGDFSYALKLLNIDENGYYNDFRSWMLACYGGKMDEIQAWTEAMVSNKKEYVKSFLIYGLQMIRAGFIYKYADRTLLRINKKEEIFLEKFSAFISKQNLSFISESISNSIYYIERSASLKIMFLNLSLYIGKQIKNANKAA